MSLAAELGINLNNLGGEIPAAFIIRKSIVLQTWVEGRNTPDWRKPHGRCGNKPSPVGLGKDERHGGGGRCSALRARGPRDGGRWCSPHSALVLESTRLVLHGTSTISVRTGETARATGEVQWLHKCPEHKYCILDLKTERQEEERVTGTLICSERLYFSLIKRMGKPAQSIMHTATAPLGPKPQCS